MGKKKAHKLRGWDKENLIKVKTRGDKQNKTKQKGHVETQIEKNQTNKTPPLFSTSIVGLSGKVKQGSHKGDFQEKNPEAVPG